MRTNHDSKVFPLPAPSLYSIDAQKELVVDPAIPGRLITIGEPRRLNVLPATGLKRELQSLLELANDTPQMELPQFLGDLERIRVTALVRLTRRTEENDELLCVDEAAAKLNVSKDYIYRNHSKFSFTRREGRKLLFSSVGLHAYMRKRRA
jgi:excisionase family DNA binding protein